MNLQGVRSCAIIAFIDEVDANPELLRGWTPALDGSTPASLVLLPGNWTPDDVASRAASVLERAGIEDDEHGPHVVALTGPLASRDFERLREVCAAAISDKPMPAPLGGLRVLSTRELPGFLAHRASGDPGEAEELREDDTRCSDAAPPTQLQELQVAPGVAVRYRATEADVGVMRQVFLEQQYSTQRLIETQWPGARTLGTRAGLGATPLIVHCGANIGASAVYFRLLYPEARVVAIEPEQDNFGLLAANTAALRDIVPRRAAVAASAGTVELTDPGTGGWGFRAGHGLDGEPVGRVPAITVIDAIEAGDGAQPFILKVDIEGAEGDMFTAHHDALGTFPIVIIELHDWMLRNWRPAAASYAGMLRRAATSSLGVRMSFHSRLSCVPDGCHGASALISDD